MKTNRPPDSPVRRIWMAAAVVLCLAIVTASSLYFRAQVHTQLAHAEQELSVITELKVQQIMRWRQERLGDAEYLRSTPYVARRATDVLKQPTIPATRQMLDASLRPFIREGSFDHLLLLDEQLNVCWSYPARASTALAEATRLAAGQALRSRKVVVADLHREVESEPVTLSLMVPFVVRREGHKDNVPAAGREASSEDRSAGVLVMQINAEKTLFPILQTWPVPSRTAETMLVRREGDEVVFLNPLRHLEGAALHRRLPLTNLTSPAVLGAAGKEGVFAGRDYRDLPVRAAVHAVPDTPWVLVAKLDEQEVLASTRLAGRLMVLAIGSAILMIATGSAYGYRRHQAGFFQKRYEVERQQREAQAIYRTTLYSLGDAVITTDTAGRVRDMNPEGERLTGWPEAEARGKPLDTVFRLISAETREPLQSPSERALREGRAVELTNQTLLVSRGGVEYPIADSAAPIRNAQGEISGVVLVFSDQTERYAARQALQESEERLRLALSSANQGCWDLNVQTGECLVSPDYARMLGQDPAQFRESHAAWRERLHPDDYAPVCQAFEDYVAGRREDYRVEFRQRLPEGGWKWILSSGRFVSRSNDGRPLRMLGTHTDITARKEAEQTLRESEDRYRSLVEESPDAIGIYQEGRLVYLNSTGVRMFGAKTREELLGKESRELIHPEDFAEAQVRVRRRLAGETGMYPAQVRYMKKDGTAVSVEVSASPISFNHKPAVQFIARDITMRLEAEARLRDSEALYHSLVEHLPQHVFRKDLTGRFTFVNGPFARSVGRPPDEILGKTDLDFFPAELAAKYQRDDQRVIETGQTIELEEELHQVGGGVLLVNAIKSPLRDAAGRIIGVQGIAWDITDRKRAEQAVRESEAFVRAVLDHLPVGIAVSSTAPPVKFSYLNANFAKFYRTTPEALAHPDAFWEAVYENADYREQIKQRVLADCASGDPERMDWPDIPLTRRGAETTYISARNVPIPDRDLMISTVWDVTERKENEKRLRLQISVLQAASNAIVITDPNGIIEWANPAFTTFTGYEVAEAIGRTPGDLLKSGRHEAAFYAAMWETIQAGKVWRGEVINRRKDGTLYTEEMTITPMMEEGRITHFIAIKQDITERKRIETRQAAFAALGHRLGAANTVREAAGIVIDVADQLLGLDACSFDLYSATDQRLVHVLNQDTIEGRRVDFPTTLSEGELSALTKRVLTQGATLIVKEDPNQLLAEGIPFGVCSRSSACIMAAPIRKGQEVIGLITIHSYSPKAYDELGLETLQALADHCGGALDRLQAEEARKESEERYRALFEQALDVVFTAATDQTITSLNPAFKAVTGFEPSDWVGRDFAPLFHPEDLPHIMEIFQQVLRNEQPAGFEARVLTSTGGFVAIEFAVTQQYRDGQIAGVMGIARDVTERRQLEYQLRQSQKMEAIGQLAGGVAHDFNNMLAVIRGNAELLLLNADQLDAFASDGLKQITTAADRAANLTRQLLAFSRKQVMQLQAANLNEVVANLTKMLNRIIGEHIELQCAYAGRAPFARVDVGMLEQALVNLVVNARDAMPHGGLLVISTRNVQLTETEVRERADATPGDFVCLTVRDTGTGIAPEHLPQIFEPFFTTKETGKGTGLGLATVYGIIKQHGGWVEVSSTVGTGTTFTVFLPAIPSPAATTVAAPESPLQGGHELVLVVEDERDVRAMTRRALESFGYRVEEAASGREALELWEAKGADVDLLLTDMVMPGGLSGRELAEQLLAKKPGLKVIYTSGYSSTVAGKDTEFLRRTASHYLQKPCATRVLIQTVRQCLDQK